MNPKLAKPTIAWTVFVVAAILVLAIYPRSSVYLH
jgi:hypothetical protein